MSSIIEMKNVSWQRSKKTILDKINWQVNPGDHWAILGLNGSGKTTMLNIINGYTWPTQGEISVLGHAFGDYDLRELRKLIGWVSSALQERIYGTDQTQDVVISGKYASIGIYVQPTEEDFEKALRLMERLGCSNVINQKYGSCSQGEKQRVLIARALMASPRLLVMDEACSGLDFLARESLLASIGELAADPDGPTILFVTHHIEEILPVFNKALLMRQGQIFAQGNSQDILNSTTLSEFFETDIEIRWQNNRPWLSRL